MKIVGLDTSSRFLCIGASDGDKVYEYNLDAGRRHSALLVPTIQRVIAALGWKLEEVDSFACGIGPGSFTGVRIGAAVVKGLSYALNKPVIPVVSLDIIAQNAIQAGITAGAKVMTVLDARRELVYSALYEYTGGVLKRKGPARLSPIAEALKRCTAATIVLGDGIPVYKKEISARALRMLDSDFWYPCGRWLISRALKEKKTTDAFRLAPVYLYPQDCQVRHG